MKRCSKCHELKPETDFYRDKRATDGLKSQCKKCHCETSIRTRDKDKHREANKLYMRRLYKKDTARLQEQWRNHKESDTEKLHARSILNSAVRHGKIQKPMQCQECGAIGKVYAHHEDYNEPLCVEWLCAECHGKRHRKNSCLGVGDRV